MTTLKNLAVSAVVAGSVAGAVAGSVAGSIAGSTAPAPGASVYSLIGATQFMALFGKMVDKSPVPEPIDPETPLTGARRSLLLQRRAEAEEEKKSEASAFSDAFAWANLKFDKIFKFRENTCANKYLKDFWATTGTFVSALFGAGFVRTVLDMFTRNVFRIVTGDTPGIENSIGKS